FGQDGSYSHEAIVNRCNADLANDLGNLAQRSLSMIYKNCDGAFPQPGPLSESDTAFLESVDGLLSSMREDMSALALHKALERLWQVIGQGNTYFAAQEPWVLRKTDPERMATVLYVTAEALRQFAILAQPFIPEGAGRLLDALAIDADARSFSALGDTNRLAGGGPLDKPQGIFPRLEMEEAPA
ncbi:MAG: methionine--tRNA ligase, partial [Pseudomonadota bacterium]